MLTTVRVSVLSTTNVGARLVIGSTVQTGSDLRPRASVIIVCHDGWDHQRHWACGGEDDMGYVGQPLTAYTIIAAASPAQSAVLASCEVVDCAASVI